MRRRRTAEWFPRVNAGSWSATRSRTGGAAPRRARIPSCWPGRKACCGSTATSSTRRAPCTPTRSRFPHVDAAGNDLQVIIPTDRDGVELFDDWDGFGQRTTATGTRFIHVAVMPHEVTTVSTAPHRRCTAFLQLYLAAVTVGIAYAAVRRRRRLRAHEGPSGLALGRRPPPTPTLSYCEAVGEISAAAASGEAVVLAAADAIDRLVDQGRHNDPESVAGVAVTVAKAQLVAERLTISAAERLFDTGGARPPHVR